jgi:hypothetical protein
MRFWLGIGPVALAALILTGCGDAPVAEKKAPEPPPAPVTGRQAFQNTYGMARAWAPDCQPLRIRSLNLPNPKSEDGKAGAWEVVYVSASRSRARTYTWSAIESEGNLHKGSFAGLEESWSAHGQEHPFAVAAIKTDTPDALAAAIAKSADYMKNPNPKPPASFVLEATSRYPDPAWRVFWGESISTAEWSVFIDASNGSYLGH